MGCLVSDRIEEYRMDWAAPPSRDRKSKGIRFGPSTARLGLVLLNILVAALIAFSYRLYYQRQVMKKRIDDHFRQGETYVEMAVVARLLRQYYLIHQDFPPDPVGYVSLDLKKNKPYPRGCDFWGSPYLVERSRKEFYIRSAGPNRVYADRDDLLFSSRY